MSVDALLGRLEGVKTAGPFRWTARCPAHEDKNPSLAIREAEDGRILVHCFAGCAVSSVVAAVGLELSDLYPDRPIKTDFAKSERRPFSAMQVLNTLATDSMFCAVLSANMANGHQIDEVDRKHLMAAASRLQEAADIAAGRT